MNSKVIAEQFSEYAPSLRYEDLPDEVVHRTKCLIIDTLGCALGGYGSDPVRIARELTANVTSKEPASLPCSGEQTSLDLAVFVNGAMIRYLDFKMAIRARRPVIRATASPRYSRRAKSRMPMGVS